MDLTWYEEIYYWLKAGNVPSIIGMLVLVWLFGKLFSKRKEANGQKLSERLMQQSAPLPGDAPMPDDESIQDWGGAEDDPYEPMAPPMPMAPTVPAHHLDPTAMPYREEGVRAGWLIALAVVVLVGAAVYYTFPQEIAELWRELTEAFR